MFGRLDVQLPEDFIDVSWHKNTCPSFELPSADKTAEWPLLTLFIDYKDQDQRECDDAPRFFLYAGSDLENWLVATEDWSQVQQCIASKRAELGMALPASASPNALVRNRRPYRSTRGGVRHPFRREPYPLEVRRFAQLQQSRFAMLTGPAGRAPSRPPSAPPLGGVLL